MNLEFCLYIVRCQGVCAVRGVQGVQFPDSHKGDKAVAVLYNLSKPMGTLLV